MQKKVKLQQKVGPVLLEDKELQAVFEPMPLAVCKECGKHFQKNGKRVYCSDKCAAEARRKQTARE